MNSITNRTYDEIEIGESATVSHMLTRQDIQLFAIMSGDVNPAHLDEEYAKSDMFHRIIGHGMWSASLISNVLGTQLPGPGTIYLDQSLHFVRPVSLGDTITARVTVLEKRPEKRVLMECVCTNQKGQEVVKGQALVIAPEEKVSRPRVQLPQVELKDNCPLLYSQLETLTEGMPVLKTAVVQPTDEYTLRGAVEAGRVGHIRPILLGNAPRIQEVAKQYGIKLDGCEVIDTVHSNAAAEMAVNMAREGKVDAIMKGKIHTDELMAEVVSKEHGLRTARRMSHVFFMQVGSYPKPFFLTDAALNIQPNLADKKDIVQNAIDLFRAIFNSAPRVALLSAVETVEESIPSTLDATALCKMADRGQIEGGMLDGPLAFDNAVSPESASLKGIVSPVAGQADILVVPDLESGNMLYKQMRFFTGCEGAGIVLGARVPIILTSRAGGVATRVASCALARIYAARRQSVANISSKAA